MGRLNTGGGAEVSFSSSQFCFILYQVLWSMAHTSLFAEICSFPMTSLQIGPLRCWPGGLCLSRSIGDMDVGEFIVPVPYVKQVKVSS